MKQKLFIKSGNPRGPISGGLRVPEGLIRLLVPGRLVYGHDNFPSWMHVVSAGYVFNSAVISQTWDDFFPNHVRADGKYWELVGPHRNSDDNERENKRNQIFCLKVWGRYETLDLSSLEGPSEYAR